MPHGTGQDREGEHARQPMEPVARDRPARLYPPSSNREITFAV